MCFYITKAKRKSRGVIRPEISTEPLARESRSNCRVETLCPIRDATLRRYLRDTVLDAYLRDTLRAWILRPDGTYGRLAPESGDGFSAQHYLATHLPLYGDDR